MKEMKMSWNRIKKMFKRKKRYEQPLRSRDLGGGDYEVNGIVIPSGSHAEAVSKYKRLQGVREW